MSALRLAQQQAQLTGSAHCSQLLLALFDGRRAKACYNTTVVRLPSCNFMLKARAAALLWRQFCPDRIARRLSLRAWRWRCLRSIVLSRGGIGQPLGWLRWS